MQRNCLLLLLLLIPMPTRAEPSWHPISWESFTTATASYPHAALRIPARIDGVDCLVQLDTGANSRFIPAPRLNHGTRDHTTVIDIGGHAATTTISSDALSSLHGGEACRHAGSVGNGLFENGTLILDLQRDRYAYVEQALLRDDATAVAFRYIQHPGWEGGHIVMTLSLPGQPEQAAMFDTGAALFGFAPFSQSLYEALRTSTGAAVDLSSFGVQIGCDIGRFETPIRVGGYMVNTGVLGHCRHAVDIGVPLAGIVGLGGLQGQTIVIDYPSRRWKLTKQADHEP